MKSPTYHKLESNNKPNETIQLSWDTVLIVMKKFMLYDIPRAVSRQFRDASDDAYLVRVNAYMSGLTDTDKEICIVMAAAYAYVETYYDGDTDLMVKTTCNRTHPILFNDAVDDIREISCLLEQYMCSHTQLHTNVGDYYDKVIVVELNYNKTLDNTTVLHPNIKHNYMSRVGCSMCKFFFEAPSYGAVYYANYWSKLKLIAKLIYYRLPRIQIILEDVNGMYVHREYMHLIDSSDYDY